MSREIGPRPGNLVYSVQEVELCFANEDGDPITVEIDSNPTTVKIKAKGTARSGGWTNPQLIPFVYMDSDVKPPENGVWHFFFTADPPAEGPVTQDMETIEASYDIEDVPEGFKGVRVQAETNYVEVALI